MVGVHMLYVPLALGVTGKMKLGTVQTGIKQAIHFLA